MIEDKMRDRLLANSDLTAKIGQNIYVNEAPQGLTGSYVVYLLVTETPLHTNTDVTDELTIQYSVFADKFADARSIARIIRDDLDRFTGTLGGISVAEIIFDSMGVSMKEKDSRKAHISYDFRITLN